MFLKDSRGHECDTIGYICLVLWKLSAFPAKPMLDVAGLATQPEKGAL